MNCVMPLRLIKLFGLIVEFTMEINSHWLTERVSELNEFAYSLWWYSVQLTRCMVACVLKLKKKRNERQTDKHRKISRIFVSKSMHMTVQLCRAFFFHFHFRTLQSIGQREFSFQFYLAHINTHIKTYK